MLEPSAAQGEDVSAYCFLPTLARGQYETSYAFTATDDEGVCHDFETYLRFQLPTDLLEPGESVTTARLLLYYAFSSASTGRRRRFRTSPSPSTRARYRAPGPRTR